MPTLLDKLFEHMWWAHDALMSELRREPPDPDTLRLFAHIMGTEHRWLTRIDAVEPRVAVWPTLSLDESAELEGENRARFRELLASPRDVLARRIRYRNSLGHDFDNDVEEILTHVALHGHYHRGQIARVMRASGREPVYTDYIGYLRKGR